ncbi:MAG: formylglycine-generating enzyme family protein [Gammaproteobacteria bacterium]|nr:formylglycine-generating enzyme family protein [Gammaproteobacteria bacterium]
MFETPHRSPSRVPVLVSSFLTGLLLSLATGLAQAGEFTNFAGLKFVDIPAGRFQMGSCKVTAEMQKENKIRIFLGQPPLAADCPESNSNVNDNETPQHTVSISAFQMGKTPITLGQFKHYVAASGGTKGSSGWNLINDDFMRYNAFGDDAPVVQVSWQEARDFIEWLNKNKPANDRGTYRLPSEAEWEYACRAGSNHAYCGGNNVNEVAWHDGDVPKGDGRHQQNVGRKAPNAWGLYDMSGNVWQWVEDAYHDSYRGAPADGRPWTESSAHASRGAPELNQRKQEHNDPANILRVNSTDYSREQQEYDAAMRALHGSSWKRDTTTARVLRGGSWKFTSDFARATYRLAASPGNWYYGNGFRVVRDLP